ncbi:hypothetical protein [Streptomyces acidiscabies]|uniref:DUF3137 domain-containing protein n=1 Tax=Streptomyces acidiscabies TaxID=42234 RepID=A0AAP6BJ73_9ACTN|nr:hypothetical protein [Streptomyces acidiscabies]MBP5938201.1 hypothetical protein [Streptomyces sp. LBUM 1476]MBZ3909218.1 hypothetical protein [Streptomyces acidiscabies]MDX2965730.1 hypothetical protein [Streptomyces acidiscabies]MDX3016375.1 hypothetical protein [Streptomyces acidiscabies]MDX3788719.1 hypothetical protein [Streptomyces acidiscabies]
MDVLMPVLVILLVGGIFAVVITAFARSRRSQVEGAEARAQAVQVAQGRGWGYQEATYGVIDRLCGMAPLPVSGSRLLGRHYISGEQRGRSFCCFEYTTGTIGVDGTGPGPNRPVYWTVFAVTAPGTGPELVVRRPEALDGVARRGRTVRLGVPEFDEAFTVLADDEAFARAALADGVVPFLAANPQAAPVRLHGGELITWYKGRLTPQGMDEHLAYLYDVLDRIPARVWSA